MSLKNSFNLLIINLKEIKNFNQKLFEKKMNPNEFQTKNFASDFYFILSSNNLLVSNFYQNIYPRGKKEILQLNNWGFTRVKGREVIAIYSILPRGSLQGFTHFQILTIFLLYASINNKQKIIYFIDQIYSVFVTFCERANLQTIALILFIDLSFLINSFLIHFSLYKTISIKKQKI
ncbi:hypothetical protein BpHYR1_043755 [Brachionus plicatilis]|uniref:Uncharacterized protein n=1 Tax=Brachionus plicatilis TaxID=10195 RepID=A0A3M7Q134_BRAPC|nr:hypothetical protein BpHYR1_043755 [Brachionus plicatilis]